MPTTHCDYPFEEFWGHVQAMKKVRDWEDTNAFGHLGKEQTSRANSARVIEYFHDTYPDLKEAGYKSMCFFGIHDYLGTHAEILAKHGFLQFATAKHLAAVDACLFRAVHYAFTSKNMKKEPRDLSPKAVLKLAECFHKINEEG